MNLDGRGTEVRFTAEARYFYLLYSVQPGSTVPLSPVKLVPESLSPWGKADHSLSSSAEEECLELYHHSPIHLHGVVLNRAQGKVFPFLPYSIT
jgi:hypothetical protein